MPFFDNVIYVSGVPRMYPWSFSSKHPIDHLLYQTSVWFWLSCLVLIIMSITLKTCINHISLNFRYSRFLSAHTACDSLSCLVVLKLSNTRKFVKNTHKLQKQSVMFVKVHSWEINGLAGLVCSKQFSHKFAEKGLSETKMWCFTFLHFLCW